MFFSNSGDKMITQAGIMRRGAALSAVLAVLVAPQYALAQSKDGTAADAAKDEAATVAPAPLSPAAIAVRDEAANRLGRKSDAFAAYEAIDFNALWTQADGSLNEKGAMLLSALSMAGDHALPAARYNAANLSALMPVGGAKLEVALTAAYLAYARDLTSGILEPRKIDRELYVYPKRPESARLMADAASATDFSAFLKALAPQHPNYARLADSFVRFRDATDSDAWGGQIARGRTMRPGERSKRVAQARARLIALGDLDASVYGVDARADDGEKIAANDVTTDVPEATFDDRLFDPLMVEAVKRFQARHGLNTDGVIGPATLRQLNISPATRAAQIAVNMERLRWLNQDLGERHILVNLAGFTMAVMNKGKAEFTSRVVVGKARKHRTPEFSEVMSLMVVNPSWHVPKSIATKEILPILKRDPSYLRRKGMRVVGGRVPEDWTTVPAGTFPGRIVQRPGRGNALGTVKFMFPNRHAIYLHDTPSKRLFNRDVRAYSHGCVRVEKPQEFAHYLLAGQVDDPEGYFKGLRKRGRERRVNLERPLPVHLTYRTAWIDETGAFQFRGDIYGRDKRVARALKKAGVTIVK